MTGRPSIYSEELATRICERIADGESLKKICESEGMPTRTTVYRWFGEHAGFNNKYARAKEEQADSIFDEVLAIADEAKAEDVQAARLRIDARKWMAGKLRPKKYGDSVNLNHSGELNITKIENVIVDPADSNSEGI